MNSADIASRLKPTESHESAILVSLRDGGYTATVRGKGSDGIALIEVYELDQLTLI